MALCKMNQLQSLLTNLFIPRNFILKELEREAMVDSNFMSNIFFLKNGYGRHKMQNDHNLSISYTVFRPVRLLIDLSNNVALWSKLQNLG